MYSHTRSRIHGTDISVAFLLGVALLSFWPISGSAAATLPTLPQVYINTTYSAPTGATCTATNSSAFQTCLNNTALNSTIVLQAGTTYTGPFTLPNKTSGSGWIYIVSSNIANLPAAGTRVSPSHAANMPKIVANSSGGSTIKTATGSHHYRFVGIEFAPVAGNFLYNNIQIGNDETSLANLPHNIVFDRCYIHGDPSAGGRRGIAMNGASIAVIDSHISDFKESGADTQALWATTTPGPIKVLNNHLEAAGENIMFGGSTASITNVVPSDIEIRRNHFFKPLSWNGTWPVKNLLEFKIGQRVLVEGNLMENCWTSAQTGWAILVTPRSEGTSMPWSTTRDITFRYNKILNVGSGINITGDDGDGDSQKTFRIYLHDNVFVLNASFGDARVFQILGDKGGYPQDVTIRHNTAFTPGAGLVLAYGPINMGTYADNITSGDYAVLGDGVGEGNNAIAGHLTNWAFQKNAWVGESSGSYPANNFFPANMAAVGFVNYAGGNYRLSTSSPYKNAGTDGKDLGADIGALEAAIASGSGGGSGGGSTSLSPPMNLHIVQ